MYTLYGSKSEHVDMGEVQYEESYGYLMRDPSYENAVVDRIQHLSTETKTAPAFLLVHGK